MNFTKVISVILSPLILNHNSDGNKYVILMTDSLKEENCNKAKCKSCPFNYNENSIALADGRVEAITVSLTSTESTHICHTTNKTCYGGLELQARLLHVIGLITEPTVSCLLETAKSILHF